MTFNFREGGIHVLTDGFVPKANVRMSEENTMGVASFS